MVDLIWMRYRPLLRWWMKITTVSLSNKLRVESLQQMSNSINRSSTGNCAWSSNRSSHATTTFVSDEVLWVLNLDSGRLSKDKECPRVDMVRCWNWKRKKKQNLLWQSNKHVTVLFAFGAHPWKSTLNHSLPEALRKAETVHKSKS